MQTHSSESLTLFLLIAGASLTIAWKPDVLRWIAKSLLVRADILDARREVTSKTRSASTAQWKRELGLGSQAVAEESRREDATGRS